MYHEIINVSFYFYNPRLLNGNFHSISFYYVLGGPLDSKTCVRRPLSKRPKIGFKDQLSLNAGQKYCRIMLQVEHSAIPSTVIKLPFVIKTFVLSILEWPFYIVFTVQ